MGDGAGALDGLGLGLGPSDGDATGTVVVADGERFPLETGVGELRAASGPWAEQAATSKTVRPNSKPLFTFRLRQDQRSGRQSVTGGG